MVNLLTSLVSKLNEIVERNKDSLWNANGLNNRRLKLETFLIEHDIDLALISETRFTDRSFLKIKNYCSYDTMHPSGRAQRLTTVIIKSSIIHYKLKNA